MQNQPEQKGLSVAKSALVGIAVATPIALGTFFLGYWGRPPSESATTKQSEAGNKAPTIEQKLSPISQKTATPPPTPAPTAVKDLRIKGNKNSMIYHLPDCASYDRIADKNVVWFKTKEEAEAAGYRMAKNCS